MSWEAARDALATILGNVSITVPITESIKKVHKYRDVSETDFPCIVMPNPPGKNVQRGPSGYRLKLYSIVMQLMVRDADVDREAQIIDSFEEAIIDAIDAAVTLGLFSGYSIVDGPNWDEAGTTVLADSAPAGMARGTITLKMVDSKNFIG